MSMQEVENQIRRYLLEANSGHNDGWTQEHYRKYLIEIKELIENNLKVRDEV